MSEPILDEFGLAADREPYSDAYCEVLTRLLDERQKIADDYAGWALWPRLPVEVQGDTSKRAFETRKNRAEDAAKRWLDIYQRIVRLQDAECALDHAKARA